MNDLDRLIDLTHEQLGLLAAIKTRLIKEGIAEDNFDTKFGFEKAAHLEKMHKVVDYSEGKKMQRKVSPQEFNRLNEELPGKYSHVSDGVIVKVFADSFIPATEWEEGFHQDMQDRLVEFSIDKITLSPKQRTIILTKLALCNLLDVLPYYDEQLPTAHPTGNPSPSSNESDDLDDDDVPF